MKIEWVKTVEEVTEARKQEDRALLREFCTWLHDTQEDITNQLWETSLHSNKLLDQFLEERDER